MAEISDYLKNLGEQTVQEEKQITVGQNPVVEEICGLFEEFDKENQTPEIVLGIYTRALASLKERQFTSKDIRDFSISLKKYEARKYFYRTGMFLSALINTSKEKDFEIITTHLPKCLSWIGGYLEEKDITVIGSVGITAGYEMKSGRIIIKGDSESNLGDYSTGGEIHVYGEANDINFSCKATIYHKGVKIWPR